MISTVKETLSDTASTWIQRKVTEIQNPMNHKLKKSHKIPVSAHGRRSNELGLQPSINLDNPISTLVDVDN